MSPNESTPPVITKRKLVVAGACAAILLASVVGIGLASRRNAEARVSKWTESQSVLSVAVIKPDTQIQKETLNLPGRLEAYTQAQLFARVGGYLKSWNADIGTVVKAGDLIAEIDAPDLDQQIMQANANLAAAVANAELASATLQRGQKLLPTGSISMQVMDQRIADATNKQGLAKSAQAEVDRLRVLEKYKRIVAPFDGLVTSRTTDIGALINAGSGASGALFIVSNVSKLRLYVNVPQTYVPNIPVGTKANVFVPEQPGRTFTAVVEASARSIDPTSGTTRMQLVIDNAGGQLLTGSYATVQLEIANPEAMLTVPASALMFDQAGLRVATVGADDRVAFKPIKISRDLGKIIVIGQGLNADDKVIDSPPDGIAEGDVVRVLKPPATTLRVSGDAKPAPDK